MFLLTQYVERHEFKPLSRFLTLDDLLDGAKKVITGLAIETKPPRPLCGFRFFKVRIGKRNGARMIVFLLVESQKIVPILIRLKKDKVFGMNMAMNNTRVVSQINKNFDHILEDVQQKRYREFPIL